MRLAVVSDTHLQSPVPELEKVFDDHLKSADMILHCGDITGESTLAYFMSHPKFLAVTGNMDSYAVSQSFPVRQVVKAEGFVLGLTHGFGLGRYPADRLPGVFGPEVDIICFGHTHERMWRRMETGQYLLNPGSMFLPRKGLAGFAYLLLEKGEEPEVLWVDLDGL